MRSNTKHGQGSLTASGGAARAHGGGPPVSGTIIRGTPKTPKLDW
jgi:hypothetical protein